MPRKYDHWLMGFGIIGISIAAAEGHAQETFTETQVLVEINATDGDIGFHALFDADAWNEVTVQNPDGSTIFEERAQGALAEQGLTENFFESSEPVCAEDLVEEDGEEIVTLEEFQTRFPAGTYTLTGQSSSGDTLTGTAELTHNLPAAPDITEFDGKANVPTDEAVIQWAPGIDLGECPFGDSIPSPESVELIGWEVVVEPEDEEAISPLRVFSVQLPPDHTSVTVPPEFLDAYVAQGVTVLKFEVGALEQGGNRTFSEGIFCTAECPPE